MQRTILIFGNHEMLLVTRSRIFEHVGYRVLTAQTFDNALLALMDHPIDVLVLCQSLNEEERRGILETAHALQPDVECAALTYNGRELELDGARVRQSPDGPTGLLLAIGKMLTGEESAQTPTVH
jgi:DNA-binding NtrC family response regulator